ncbi:MAG: LysR family transcriptional regulator [Burkholderiaceae bacterium]|nr:LysR family transcriptional regulator [Burkholderiales bacterium]MCZ8339489.1 LysR family transcriptional regulator [Burkholderiaceae bacterium]
MIVTGTLTMAGAMELEDVDLNLLPVFAAVADEGGFTAAADRLGTSKARVSRAARRRARCAPWWRPAPR